MFCKYCGNQLEDNAAYCLKCGRAVNDVPSTCSAGKRRIAAGLLAIFLGSLGIHNFYLGDNNRGLTQLLVSVVGGIVTCGIATFAIEVWALIEGIQIFTGSINTDANGVPLKD